MPQPVCRRCDGSGIEVEAGLLPGIPPLNCRICDGAGRQPVWALSVEGWEIQFRRCQTERGTDLEMQDMAVRVLTPAIRKIVHGR